MNARSLARGAAGGLFVALAAAIAYRYGGGADAAPLAAAQPAHPVQAAPVEASGEVAYEVKTRLIDALGEARAEVPGLQAGLAMLAPHWRRMNLPFGPDDSGRHERSGPEAEARKLTLSIALRTSDREQAWSTPMPGGGTWTPSARVWNMNEGSYDQREAIFAPAPAVLSYRVSVPPQAVLSFAAALVNHANEDAVFEATVVDAGGAAHPICTVRLSAYQASTWHDTKCSLEAWGGHDVELRLETKAVPRDPHAPKPVEPHKPDAGVSPGAGAKDGDDTSEPELGKGIPLALWGHPVILAKEPAKVPYNVLWIVIDALRPDVLASFHDDAEDAKKLAAPHPPLEALLPKIEGLTPSIDALAQRGTRFMHAYSAATWTRPGTLAMLAGARSTEVGIDTLRFVLPEQAIANYYRSDPPLISRVLRKNGVVTRAFVNNFFMAGYASAGLDMGFERVSDYRYHTRDTAEITRDATTFIRENAGDRFFLFCNYNSPHAPWEPPPRFLERVPPPPKGPADEIPREYMGEAAKDDEAVGELLRALDEAHLRERTIVVVTADHGETLSSAHAGVSQLDNLSVRFHHAAGNYEETSRIPILISLPGVLPENAAVGARVRSIDIAPTVLDLEKLERPSRMSGLSMLPLLHPGAKPEEERVVLTEGRGTRGLIAGRYRLLVREGDAQTTKHHDVSTTVAEELFDLEDDPGERKNIAQAHPDIVAEMRARLAAAAQNVPVAGSRAADAPGEEGSPIHLRFAGKEAAHRVSGSIQAAGGAQLHVAPVSLAAEAFKVADGRVEFAFDTARDGAVGFDLRVEPEDAKLGWELYLDDQPWPEDGFFAGPLGLYEPHLRHGIDTDEARTAIAAAALPEIDAAHDLGLFVTRAQGAEWTASAGIGAGADEMSRMLRAWGYAHGSGAPSHTK